MFTGHDVAWNSHSNIEIIEYSPYYIMVSKHLSISTRCKTNKNYCHVTISN